MTGSTFTRRAALRRGTAGALGLSGLGVAAGAHGAEGIRRSPSAAARLRLLLGSIAAGAAAPLELTQPTDMVAVEWTGPRRRASVELRVRRQDGSWSRWVQAATLHSADAEADANADAIAATLNVGEPIWVGGARAVQLRAGQAMSGVALHTLELTQPLALAADAAVAPLPLYPAGPGQPQIIPRAIWAGGSVTPRVEPVYGKIQLAFVHHTESLNGYSRNQSAGMVRAIGQFHRDVRGWNDIGYNFLVDRFGRVFEGRAGGIDQPVVGAQAGGYNLASTGVALLGSFSAERPAAPAVRSLERLIAWKLALHGVPTRGKASVRVNRAGSGYARFPAGAQVALARVSGHRDGCSTDCPGNALYRELPAIRRRVHRLAGRETELSILPLTTPAAVGAALALSGRFAFSDGMPISGAPIELRAQGAFGVEVLIASTRTAPDGSWTAQVVLARDAQLRAVHSSAPARVSHTIDVTLAPAVAPPAGTPPQAP